MNMNRLALSSYIRKGSLLIQDRPISINIPNDDRPNYLGMSSITDCGRLLWFRMFSEDSIPQTVSHNADRYKRIFITGHIFEDLLIQIINLGGGLVTDRQSEISALDGKFRGHVDGVLDQKFVLEIKTMNNDNFLRFQSVGLKEFSIAYYTQLCLYCFYKKIDTGALLAYNKNTSMTDSEFVSLDLQVVEEAIDKARSILSSSSYEDINPKYVFLGCQDKCTYCPLKRVCYK